MPDLIVAGAGVVSLLFCFLKSFEFVQSVSSILRNLTEVH